MRSGLHQIAVPAGSTDGDVATYNSATDELELSTPAAPGITSVVAGNNIEVDDTDPDNPVVSAAELLMQDGVTSPPVPIETEAGDDWLYEG